MEVREVQLFVRVQDGSFSGVCRLLLELELSTGVLLLFILVTLDDKVTHIVVAIIRSKGFA